VFIVSATAGKDSLFPLIKEESEGAMILPSERLVIPTGTQYSHKSVLMRTGKKTHLQVLSLVRTAAPNNWYSILIAISSHAF